MATSIRFTDVLLMTPPLREISKRAFHRKLYIYTRLVPLMDVPYTTGFKPVLPAIYGMERS